MYGSECWGLTKAQEQRLHATKMKMLHIMEGVTRRDKIKIKYIKGSLKVATHPGQSACGKDTWGRLSCVCQPGKEARET